MITPNHGLSGYICAQVAMPLLRRRSPLSERVMAGTVFLGAMLPDGDILTRWLLGRGDYFSGAWYAHRGLSHSLGGTLIVALVLAALLYRPLAGRQRPATGEGPTSPRAVSASGWVAYAWLVGCLWAGGLLHIFGDLFTPGWQMPVAWPFASLGERIGGWRHIGWFSPYLFWLFLATVALGYALKGALRHLGAGGSGASPGRLLRSLPAGLWALYVVAAYRWVDFLVHSRYESRTQWEAFHGTLLPEALIVPVTRGISTVWHWFTG